jgi:hypothetical protein
MNEKGEKEEKYPRLLGAGKGIWINTKAGYPARRRDGKRRKSQFLKTVLSKSGSTRQKFP